MTPGLGTAFAILLVLSISGNSKGLSDEVPEESGTPPTYLQYKVKALNTALYYILQALHDDLVNGLEVDVSFLNRINIIIAKIKYFYGQVDETNALMLGELLKTFPGYLVMKMEQAGLNFTDYAVIPSTDSLGTISSTPHTDSTIDSAGGGNTDDNVRETDIADNPDSADSIDSDDSND